MLFKVQKTAKLRSQPWRLRRTPSPFLRVSPVHDDPSSSTASGHDPQPSSRKPSSTFVSGVYLQPNGTCPPASPGPYVRRLSAVSTTFLTAADPETVDILTGKVHPCGHGSDDMCGIVQTGVCRFSELAPGQFGLTKQLVLRIALPHITLLVVSMLYAVMGSWFLTFLHYNDNSPETAQQIVKAQSMYADRLLSMAAEWQTAFNEGRIAKTGGIPDEYLERDMEWLIDYAQNLRGIYNEYPKAVTIVHNIQDGVFMAGNPLSNLTFNVFFATTTLTSIGYGTNAPDSFIGRLFCLIYISVGIPLYLVTMADLAKFCTEGMNRMYTEFLKFRYQVVRLTRRIRKKGRLRSDSVKIGEVIIAGGEDEVAEFIWTHLENTQFVEIPFILVYLLLLSYVSAAAFAISCMEGWTIYDSFYFLCSSVLTIGFGDLVPKNDKFVLLTMFLVLLGLILTTTCVDIVGAYYIDHLHFFGRSLETEDPLIWLKAVQQKRIEAMKREAMRKLFETITALHHMRFGDGFGNLNREASKSPASDLLEDEHQMRLPDAPNPPRDLIAYNATAESVSLKWEPPTALEEGKRYWYTLTFKTRTPQRRNHLTVVDFITTEQYEVSNLKSFTLYEFTLVTTTRFGASKPIRTHEYTEPCTVPQLLNLEAVSAETATISWKTPRKNNGVESYVVQFSAEPAPQFHYWERYKVGKAKRFTLTDLCPDTKYIVCVSAEHNFGLAAMSKSIRFRTRAWCYDDEIFNPHMHLLSPIPPGLYTLGTSHSGHRLSVSSYGSLR